MSLLKHLNEIAGAKTHKVPAGTFSEPKKWEPSKGRDKDDPNWDWKNPNDNPSGEKPVGEKPHKVNGKHDPANYPTLPDEFDTPLFDPQLVSHIKSEYGVKEWNKMSELEQIKAQLGFTADIRAPAFGRDSNKFETWLDKEAKKLQSKIKRG